MPKSYRDLVNEAKSRITEVSPEVAEQRRKQGWQMVDVRTAAEYKDGTIPGSVHIDRNNLESGIERAFPDRDEKLILYCASGYRSALAAVVLEEMGYTKVVNMAEGVNGWKNRGLDWEIPQVIDPDQLSRYHRHILLPEVGVEGQTRLLNSKVLLLGAGGLGSPAALYLAAAGVGTLGIVDYDVVDQSNLQRQILHSEDRVGMLKVESAKETIRSLNPDVKVETYNTRLQADNVLEIMSDYDVVVDGCDNFPTRYLVNDASILIDKPVVHGSIFRFDGQVSVFWPNRGPCYRCLYHQPPPPELAPSCEEAGVLGVLPGIIGSLQAVEAIKLLLDIGDPLIGRLLTFDALEMSFRVLKLRRDPDCPSCRDGAEIVLVDYDQYCMPPGFKPEVTEASA